MQQSLYQRTYLPTASFDVYLLQIFILSSFTCIGMCLRSICACVGAYRSHLEDIGLPGAGVRGGGEQLEMGAEKHAQVLRKSSYPCQSTVSHPSRHTVMLLLSFLDAYV